MLLFIYSDVLPDIQELTGSVSMSTSTIFVQHLLAAADCYGLDRLKLLCEANLCEEVSADTVATTLALAERHHCAQLKSVCLKFAVSPGNLEGGYVHRIGALEAVHFPGCNTLDMSNTLLASRYFKNTLDPCTLFS